MNKIFAVVLLGVAAGAVYLPACAATLSVENRPCPCATGWTCCESQSVCVAEGTVCPEGPDSSDAADDGSPRVIAATQSPRCMTADQDHLYWQNADGTMIEIEKSGGVPQPALVGLWGDGAIGVRCWLTTDGTSIYSSNHETGTIVRYVRDESGRLAWVEGAAYLLDPTPSSIAVDDAHLYVTSDADGRITKLKKSVFRKSDVPVVNNPIRPGDVETLATGLNRPDEILVAGESLIWREGDSALEEFKKNADGGAFGGAVKRMPKSGGEIQILASGLLAPSSLVVAGKDLFFSAGGDVWAVEIDGGTPPRIVSQGQVQSGTRMIATDGQALFFGASHSVRRLAMSGSSPGDVLYETFAPALITVDETRVFWVTGDRVMAAAK